MKINFSGNKFNQKKRINKKAIEMSFNWIFALVAGGVIIFLAIFGVSRFIQTGEKAISTETAAQVISLLDPFETGLASGKSSLIDFKKDSRIYFDCSELDNKPFGRETISFSEQSLGEKYGEKSEPVSIKNKYVFADDLVEGKKLFIFSMPFSMPFKVADIIGISSKNYCFYKAPNKIQDDFGELNLKNVYFSDDLKNCTEMETVCFGSGNDCDIDVFSNDETYEYGRVAKGKKEMVYVDNLLYAAIFSSSEIYECNVKRLMSKFNELSLIYINKIDIIERKGCSSSIGSKLSVIRGSAGRLQSSDELLALFEQIDEIGLINQGTSEGCKLY